MSQIERAINGTITEEELYDEIADEEFEDAIGRAEEELDDEIADEEFEDAIGRADDEPAYVTVHDSAYDEAICQKCDHSDFAAKIKAGCVIRVN